MEVGARTSYGSGRFYSRRVVAIGLATLGVFSPLLIDQRQVVEAEEDEESVFFALWLPGLLLVLILAISLSLYFDRGFSGFDPYWIHRVGGSSGGIFMILIVLALVLKFKHSF